MAHESLATVVGQLVGMGAEQGCNLGLDGLRQQRSRAVAQNLGQRISKSSWLGELENVSVGHGVSLLRWRSGGPNNPHDTPPYLFMPSPTFAHSSVSGAPHHYVQNCKYLAYTCSAFGKGVRQIVAGGIFVYVPHPNLRVVVDWHYINPFY